VLRRYCKEHHLPDNIMQSIRAYFEFQHKHSKTGSDKVVKERSGALLIVSDILAAQITSTVICVMCKHAGLFCMMTALASLAATYR
jgi:hypothetical protein